jgi:hypothetical protein
VQTLQMKGTVTAASLRSASKWGRTRMPAAWSCRQAPMVAVGGMPALEQDSRVEPRDRHHGCTVNSGGVHHRDREAA